MRALDLGAAGWRKNNMMCESDGVRRIPCCLRKLAISVAGGFIVISVLAGAACGGGRHPANDAAERINIVPVPAVLREREGEFTITADTVVYASPDAGVRRTGAFLSKILSKESGHAISADVARTPVCKNAIYLLLDGGSATGGSEAYDLDVTPARIVLRAATPEGIFRGAQTIRQLVPAGAEPGVSPYVGKQLKLPCVYIHDEPRFLWRGLNLDCSRHFMSKDFIKRYIDLLAYYKMNIFHWHLIDDQGWRLEIKRYPLLTSVGAWRRGTDGKPYGGFYTQDDVRDIVRYARERYITILPEIEMPGHCQSALAAYPELSCTGSLVTVSRRWGIHRDVYCAGSETTFRFLENVLDEVIALFPGEYIHIGGDECLKYRWKRCPKCLSRMVKEGHKNEKELQCYFIRRMEKYLLARGRRVIGWDEILQGGLAPSATVQSWQGFDGAIQAVKAGRRAVVSPTAYTYFDYGLAVTDMEKVYSFEPVPPGLTDTEKKLIMGSEANMWTEFAPQETVDGKLFPRMLALSEVMWSPGETRDFGSFQRRVRGQYARLAGMGVAYGAETEPGILKIKYFMRDVKTFIDIVRNDPGSAMLNLKMYFGMEE